MCNFIHDFHLFIFYPLPACSVFSLLKQSCLHWPSAEFISKPLDKSKECIAFKVLHYQLTRLRMNFFFFFKDIERYPSQVFDMAKNIFYQPTRFNDLKNNINRRVNVCESGLSSVVCTSQFYISNSPRSGSNFIWRVFTVNLCCWCFSVAFNSV